MSNTVIFKTLRGANFLRFGNEEFVFNFYEGVIGLMGENGLGKSAILDAICICLFNETYRPSVQSMWTNNINEKGLYLNLELETHGVTVDKYLISRKPTSRKTSEKLMIYKNDVLLTGVTNYQEYIENVILGFGINIFRNTIAVSGGTPFISMTPEEKRKFAENLFSIKQVREYKKKAGELLSEVQLSKRMVSQEIMSARSKVVEYQNVLQLANSNTKEAVEGIDSQIDEMQATIDKSRNDIGNYQTAIDQVKDKIESANAEVAALEAKLVELDANNIVTAIAKTNAELEMCKREYKNELEAMKRIAPDVICTECGNSYTPEQSAIHSEKHLIASKEIANRGKELRAKLDELQALLPTIDNVKSAIKTIKYSEIAGYNNEITRLNTSIYSVAGHCNTLETVIYNLKVKKDKILNQPDQNDVKALAEKSIVEANELIATRESDLIQLDRKINACNYISSMCSDDGIKKMLLREFVPVLNKLIVFYLDKFDLPVTVEFDEYFGHKLSAPKGLGQLHGMMSKGQKTRINLAILFAIVDLVKRIGNVRCNLLMLDEFADEGLDAKGFTAAVNSIRRVADADNKTVVLITHKQEDILYDNLDALYELELRNQFSVLKEISSF